MNKAEARLYFRQKRSLLSRARRTLAMQRAYHELCRRTDREGFVLSYASFGAELSTQIINADLLKKGQLVLPRVEGDRLALFHVEKESSLVQNRWGVWEPDPAQSRKCPFDAVTDVFVPGVAFDRQGNRLGYGKGFYDRLLSLMPAEVQTVGVGFCEQLSSTLLATTPYDIPVQTLALF